MKYTCVVLAAGQGSRLNLGFNKVHYKLKNGYTILENALSNFVYDQDCIKIILVINEQVKLNIDTSKIVTVSGGLRRQDSVLKGLELVETEYVMIHDGARPYLSFKHLDEIKKTLLKNDAVILGVKAKDTVKHIDNNGFIVETYDRNFIVLAQTPQAFKTTIIKQAYKQNIEASDDASMCESVGIKVKVVFGDYQNNKITFIEDLK